MTAIILMLIAFPLALFWSASRAAAEEAQHVGRKLCQRAGVQWLDQSVHQIKLGLQRNDQGRLHFKRVYQYEYSHDGDDRHTGNITLVGLKATSWIEPIARRAE